MAGRNRFLCRRNLAAPHDTFTSRIERQNAGPKPFRWTRSADDILASIERFCVVPGPAG